MVRAVVVVGGGGRGGRGVGVGGEKNLRPLDDLVA